VYVTSPQHVIGYIFDVEISMHLYGFALVWLTSVKTKALRPKHIYKLKLLEEGSLMCITYLKSI
jgi:hypothetical protein